MKYYNGYTMQDELFFTLHLVIFSRMRNTRRHTRQLIASNFLDGQVFTYLKINCTFKAIDIFLQLGHYRLPNQVFRKLLHSTI